MATDSYLAQLNRRAARLFGAASIPDVHARTRAIVGPGQEVMTEQAAAALESLRAGEVPDAAQLAALEAAIRQFRPSLPIPPDNRVPGLPGTLPELRATFPRWDEFAAAAQPLLASVGRLDQRVVDRAGRVTDYPVGTGFLVGPGRVLSNRHVLEQLSSGAMALAPGMALFRPRYEYGAMPAEPAWSVRGVIAVSAEVDLALLAVEAPDDRPALSLIDAPAEVGEPVAVLGFPARDTARNPLFGDALISRYEVKNLAPGELLSLDDRQLSHDCSTTGGCSGAPVLRVSDARLLGVHASGQFLWRNEGVAAPAVASFLRGVAP